MLPHVSRVLFLLKKILGNALMPLSLVLLLQLLALALLVRRKTRAAASASITGLVLLVVACNEGVGDRLTFSLESRHPPIYLTADDRLPAPYSEARYIAVLGGGHYLDPRLSALGRLSASSLSRLVEAVRLARLLPEARLITCGPCPNDDPYLESHASVLARAAVELGIDPARITQLPDGRDTHDEALEIRALVNDAPVLLVTSAWHMPRALGLARTAGVDATPAPADYSIAPIGNPPSGWFRFSVFGLERTTQGLREYLGLAWTRLRGQR